MSLEHLTDKEKNILLQLSYLDLPPDLRVSEKRSLSIDQILMRIEKENIDVDKKRLENIKKFMDENEDTNLKDVKLIGYQNHNPNENNNTNGKSESGFVGYALKDQDDNKAILFRGSENPAEWGNLKTDWWGNIKAGMGFETEQHEEANEFYKNYTRGTTGEILIAGHSKGSNITTDVFLKHLKDNVKAYVVNGAPVFYFGLSDKEKKALKGDRYTFITYVGDIVSHLGVVTYLDKIVVPKSIGESIDPFFFHYETSADFNKDGTFAKWYYPGDSQLFDVTKDVTTILLNTGIFLDNKVSELEFALRVAAIEIAFLSAKGIYDEVQPVIDGCVKFAASVNLGTQKFLTDLAEFLVDVARQTRLFFAKVAEATRGYQAHAEEIIKVDLARLHYYIERLQAVKRKTARVNDMIDDLYWQAGILGIDNILKADISTQFNFKLTDSINYLRSAAATLEQVEARLTNKARLF
jgi:hypothetical protein